MKFRATLEPAGNATAVEVPARIVDALGSGKRPRVVATINGHTWRSAVVPKGGRFLLGVSAANRAGSGVSEGDEVEVDVVLDAKPRVITEPPDLAAALKADPKARAAFDRLSYSHKRRHVLDIENAKTPETRQRRIAKAISTIRTGR